MAKIKTKSNPWIIVFILDLIVSLGFLISCFAPTAKYTVTYMVDGETVATREYTEDNTGFPVPIVPEKKGYSGRWEYVELDGGNKTVNAIYTVVAYTVTFKAGGATLALYPYTVEDYADVVAPEVPKKAHYIGEWSEYDLSEGGNQTVYAVYKAIPYTVTYVADGKTVDVRAYTLDNKDVAEPKVPEKAHYTGEWETVELNGGNKTVNAVYTPIEYAVTYIADGETVNTQTYTVEDKKVNEPRVPEKAHYTGEWSSYELNYQNAVVRAIYTPIEYTATFVAEGKTIVTLSYNVEDTDFAKPSVPAKEHYAGAWETYELDGGNKTINAVYEPITYNVTFNGYLSSVKVEYNVENTEIEEVAIPQKPHYTGEWEEYELEYNQTQTVNAIYKAIPYTVTYKANGETVAVYAYTVESNAVTPPEMPLEEYETEEGYVMVGVWEDVPLDGGDKIINAVYEEKTYSITYIVVPDTGLPKGVDDNLFNDYWSGSLWKDGTYPTSYKSSEGAWVCEAIWDTFLPVGGKGGINWHFAGIYVDKDCTKGAGYYYDSERASDELIVGAWLYRYKIEKGTKGDLVFYFNYFDFGGWASWNPDWLSENVQTTSENELPLVWLYDNKQRV